MTETERQRRKRNGMRRERVEGGANGVGGDGCQWSRRKDGTDEVDNEHKLCRTNH